MCTELKASPEELLVAFYMLETRRDIAELLDIRESQLIYYLYILPEYARYEHFHIPKKMGGGAREIYAPVTSLKIIQHKLKQVLETVYRPKPSAHGFLANKSILSNALPHAKKRYVLNLDLKDFFPSINFGRVRGLLMAAPYSRNHEVATTLAQICCYQGILPQGAPTSPVVSNMICAKLDSHLQKLAKEQRCTYTRYADDITFSTSRPNFPKGLAYFSNETGVLELGEELKTAISRNGFRINERKNRLQPYSKRQEVTGLTVNLFPNVTREYVREIRGMLHAWEKYGLEAAENTYRKKYAGNHPEGKRDQISFKRVVQGKLNFLKMVRGENNRVYVNLVNRFWVQAPEYASDEKLIFHHLPIPLIHTEGKTDWKHLKSAFNTLKKLDIFPGLEILFHEFGDETPMGDGELLKMCEAFSKVPQPQPIILVFDRDKQESINKVMEKEKPYKSWGNNVFSFAIPIPAHRSDITDVCIELYYHDKDLKRKDNKGRRLYLGEEFDSITKKHKTTERIYTTRSGKIRPSMILDSQVLDFFTSESYALSKDDFAELVANNDPNFHDIDFSEFSKIFDVVVTILSDMQQTKDNNKVFR